MRALTVLGTCGAWPEAGRGTAGFLLQYDGFRLVLDLGYGTFPRLLEHCPAGEVDAVVVTHEHPDHCADLSALGRARYFAKERHARLPLLCPPGVVEGVQAMEPSEDLHEVFEVYSLPSSCQVGPFRLDAMVLPHHVPHAGVRLTAPGLTLAYSGDAGPAPALAELAGVDLFIGVLSWIPPASTGGGTKLLRSGARGCSSPSRRTAAGVDCPSCGRDRMC